jgi:DNA-binding SARP family transcriptional activator
MDVGMCFGDAPLFRIRLWGPFRAEKRVGEGDEAVKTADWGGSNYPRLLLKALLCCPSRRGRRDALMEMLWPEIEIEQATANLNTATTKLRTLLRPTKGQESLLVTEDDATIYQLPDQRVIWVDGDAAHQSLEAAEHLGRASVETLPLLEEAINLSGRGPFLEGEEGLWAAERRATHERERYRARLWLVESYVRQAWFGKAETILNTLLENDPFDEDVLRRLLMLFHQQGMTHQALRLYVQTRDYFHSQEMELTDTTQNLVETLRRRPLLQGWALPEASEESNFASPSSLSSSRLSSEQQILLPHLMTEEAANASFVQEGKELSSGIQDMASSRREFFYTLGLLGAEALAFSQKTNHFFFQGAALSQLSDASLRNLETITQQFRAMQRRGETFIAGGVNMHLKTIEKALERTVDDGQRRELWRILAKAQIIASFHPRKKTEQGITKTFLEVAYTSAQQSGDSLLVGSVLGHLAQFSLREEHNLTKALQLLDRARECAPRSHPLQGWFALILSSLAAKTGQEEVCRASLDEAMTRASSLGERPEADDLYFTDFAVISASVFSVNGWLTLGKTNEASVALTTIDFNALSDNRRASALHDASKVHALLGDVDRAQKYAFQAIDKALSTQQLYVLSRCISFAQSTHQSNIHSAYATAVLDYAHSALLQNSGEW